MFNLKRLREDGKVEEDDEVELIAAQNYKEITPKRECTLRNFPGSEILFEFSVNGAQWWNPATSYLRGRFHLCKPDDTPLTLSDGIAPAADLMAQLFQSMYFKINGVTVAQMNQNIAQIYALESRLHRPEAWLKTIGASLSLSQTTFEERQQRFCRATVYGTEGNNEGNLTGDRECIYRASLFYPVPSTTNNGDVQLSTTDLVLKNEFVLEYDVATGFMTFQKAANAIPVGREADFTRVMRQVVSAGGTVVIGGDEAYPIEAVNIVDGSVGVGNNAISLRCPRGLAAIAPTQLNNIVVTFINPLPLGKYTYFELVWTPPLSIFKLPHALPCGKYELWMQPASSNFYQELAVETNAPKLPNNPKGLLNNGDYKFEVVDLTFMLHSIDGERVPDQAFVLDLYQTRCQTNNITTNSYAQKNFDVSPSTKSLTLAFQDSRVTGGLQYQPSRFVVQDHAELGLIRFQIEYAGQQKPGQDITFKWGNNNNGVTERTDYTTRLYYENLVQNAMIYCEGGSETLGQWQERGSYYHFEWQKDGQDMSTNARVYTQFNFNGSIGMVQTANILLFDNYRARVTIQVRDGAVAAVQYIEA